MIARHPILYQVGQYLHYVDAPKKVKTLYILPNSTKLIYQHAALLLESDSIQEIVCIESEIGRVGRVIGRGKGWKEIHEFRLNKTGIPLEQVQFIQSSGILENLAKTIQKHCEQHQKEEFIVMMGDVYSRRLQINLALALENTNIKANIYTLPSTNFDIKHWWANEAGMIAVSGEIFKIMNLYRRTYL